MRVLIINFFAGNRTSGWGERHFFLAKELIAKGNEVTIISAAKTHVFSKHVITEGTFTFRSYEGVKFCWVEVPPYRSQSVLRFWSMIVFTFKLFFLPLDRIGKIDLIWVSSMPMFPILPALWIKMKLKSNYLAFEIRDLWPLTPILLGHISKWNPMIILMKIIEKKAYRSSDLIISLLPKANSYVNTISRNAGKFFYLPNGFSDHVNEDGIIPDELTNKIPTEKFILGYAGSLGIANAMSVVIEAAKILRDLDDIHFLIIGDGYLKDALIEQAGKINNITFLPKIKKGLVHKVVAKFNVGIISWNDSPLYDYGVSANKLFDYMNAAIPIISAGRIADDPVRLGNCGLVIEPENPKLMTQAILQLKELSFDERLALGNNGKKYLEASHSYEKLAKSLLTRING